MFMCSYVEKYDLQEPSDNIQHVLKRIAVKLGKTQKVNALTGVGEKTAATRSFTVVLSLLLHVCFGVWSFHKKFTLLKCLSRSGNIRVIIPDYTAAAYNFIRAFRKGELGQVMLD